MRWATYASSKGARTGLVHDGRIHALPPGESMLDLLGDDGDKLREAADRALTAPAAVARLEEVSLLAPIPRPPSIRDCLCFLDHMRNCLKAAGAPGGLGPVWYEIPAFYFACPSSVLGAYDDVPIAPGSAWFDFELEVAAVIGRPGRDLTPDEAQRSIAGYMLMCDWSARDLQMLEGELRIGQAKGKDSATTLGPFLLTPDEFEFAAELTVSLNGRRIGSGSPAAMDWSFGEVISYASRGVELQPGDLFGSGTLPGCSLVEHFSGGSFPGWLTDGDVVTLSGGRLGETRQTIRRGPDPHPLPPRPGHPSLSA
ncbi:fumarylacetoacetate hydrolase family protein [Nonomuraea dietziae]|uniref:fumarylacetoacetate hydrolase family protein n=1 Tax=Nonomuraea dietziae TaxID=65515 RepID=UPI0033F0A7A0